MADGQRRRRSRRARRRSRPKLISRNGRGGRVRHRRAVPGPQTRSTRISMPETATARPRADASAKPIKEAIAEEMRRDPTVVILGRGRRRGGHHVQGAHRARRRVRQGSHHRHADLGGRVHRPRRRRGDDRPAADRRHHVRRLPDDSSWTRWSTRPPRSTTCPAANGKCRWSMRATMGATRRSAAQHSQSLHAWLEPHSRLEGGLPSTPYDAKGLLKTAIRDDNPVVIFEDKMLYKSRAGAGGGIH